MTERLSARTLSKLPSSVARPGYDRAALKAGVVHLGVGNFHRAHQAPVFEALIKAGDRRWGIVGASLRSAAVRESLVPQDCLYSLTVDSGDDRQTRIIGSLTDVIVAAADGERLLDALASPHTHLVTVTVTEKGYKIDGNSGALLTNDPDVQSDVAKLDRPITLPGLLVAGLRRRMQRDLSPLTIISCDNMAANGRKLQIAVLQMAGAHDRALAEWVEDQCTFPNTMIDRIVPATSETDIARTTLDMGVLDRAAVRTEPFTQWVIEDRFAGARPELEHAGVQFTRDVEPWERAKLRLLNGAHSAMAYLGCLAGIATVHDFVAQPWGRAFVERLWDEIEPTLGNHPDLDLPAYRQQLMQRFENSALAHRLMQIAIDGSQKLPQRLVAPALDILNAGGLPDAIALALAAWMRWQCGRTDVGERFTVDDPLASTTARMMSSAAAPDHQVEALLSLSAIFPQRLRQYEPFKECLVRHLSNLQRIGAVATVRRFLAYQPAVTHAASRS